MAEILDGKSLRRELNTVLKVRASELVRPPGLAVVLVGDDPASSVYVNTKTKVAEALGFHQEQIHLPAATSQAELMAVVARLNDDPVVDGILVQLPLPEHIDATTVLDSIDPAKDVDGFHPVNVGLLSQGRPRFVPCTPLGCMKLLEMGGISTQGADAVVVGRSNIVGRPMAMLLQHANATVTTCHSRTRDLEAQVRRADIVVAAIGRAEFVKGAWIKDGATVLDVGINRTADGRLVGDVEYAPAAERAAWITPVPGGVGPMTIAMLMHNTFEAAKARLA